MNILKDLEIPIKKLKIEAAKRRAVFLNEEEINREYRNICSGYRGEHSLKFFLSFLPQKNFFIFHNLRLPSVYNENHFQIDLLIVTNSFFIIFEVKNYSGTLKYDNSFNQLTQYYEDQINNYPDPIEQVNRQRTQLQGLIHKKFKGEIKLPPIYSFVVLSNSKTLIEATSNDMKVNGRIIRSDKVVDKVLQCDNYNKEKVIDDKLLKKLNLSLKKMHVNEEYDVLRKLKIRKDEIQTGVYCSKCNVNKVIKKKLGWYCAECQETSNNAHFHALLDYLLLLGDKITSKELQWFLELDSLSIARNLINSLKLEKVGKNKNAQYILPMKLLLDKIRES